MAKQATKLDAPVAPVAFAVPKALLCQADFAVSFGLSLAAVAGRIQSAGTASAVDLLDLAPKSCVRWQQTAV